MFIFCQPDLFGQGQKQNLEEGFLRFCAEEGVDMGKWWWYWGVLDTEHRDLPINLFGSISISILMSHPSGSLSGSKKNYFGF